MLMFGLWSTFSFQIKYYRFSLSIGLVRCGPQCLGVEYKPWVVLAVTLVLFMEYDDTATPATCHHTSSATLVRQSDADCHGVAWWQYNNQDNWKEKMQYFDEELNQTNYLKQIIWTFSKLSSFCTVVTQIFMEKQNPNRKEIHEYFLV